MAASPSSLTLRMYNVGFGDCFLLSFEYSDKVRHVLVDYGSTSAPKRGGTKDYMAQVADDIKKVSGGKLDGVIAPHRHRDHVSGFSTDAGTGKVIASLKPDFVIQPWTEDPKAKVDALTASSSVYSGGKADPQKMTAHYLRALEDMHRVAQWIHSRASEGDLADHASSDQLQFLGEDNIKNSSAVKNLMAMGKRGRAYYVHAGMTLELLPGVKCTVLGPPTLEQSDTIRKQRSRDPAEFWQFRSFWGSQGMAARTRALGPKKTSKKASVRDQDLPLAVRWFANQSQRLQANQILSIVRDLDSVMNNTSVILLLEIGEHKVLLPGDAQLENWLYALSKPEWRKLLADVNIYKVGHHGSLNATPKSLWALFKQKGAAGTKNRLETLCSTKGGKHGSSRSGTEVPRQLLVDQLKKESRYTSSEEAKDAFCHVTKLPLTARSGST